ncbi:MAG TPA: phosphatidate cytidylyltransferase [Victivallales bacterium]|nr:phosphatidate cytidylyltransferase [Victivallales bacterium]
MKVFFYRFISSIGLIGLCLWMLSSKTKSSMVIFFLFSLIISALIVKEFHFMFRNELSTLGKVRILPLFCSILPVIGIMTSFIMSFNFCEGLFLVLLIILIFFSLQVIFFSGDSKTFHLIMKSYAPVIFFVIPISHIMGLYIWDWRSSSLFALFLITVTKSGDIGAYVVGTLTASFMKNGNHKMIPKISPKKSWEGFFAGLVSSVLVGIFASSFLPSDMGIRWGIFFGFVLYFGGVAGDLIESVVKRSASVKDSGCGIPGIGGILDLVDSLVINAPLFYYVINFKEKFL